MEDNNEIEFDFSNGDVEIDVDNNNAVVPDGWYVLKITSATAKKKFNEKVGAEVINCSPGLVIDEGPFAGTFVSMFLPFQDPRPYAAKIRKAFFRAIGVDDTEFRVRFAANTEGKAELQDVIGERIGAMVKTNTRDGKDFIQVAFDSIVPVDEVPNNNGDNDDSPFV